jgi:HSP20 family protein
MSSIEDELRQQLSDAVDAANHPQPVPVNVYETEEALVVVAAMPGVMADDITVAVEPGRLTMTSDLRTAAPKHYLVHEWHYGPYRREIGVPDGFGASVAAAFGNGQLAVHLGRGDATVPYTVQPSPLGTHR